LKENFTVTRWALLLCLAMALLGAACCASLCAAHLSLDGLLLTENCGQPESDCGRVLASRWAVWPPADPQTFTGEPSATGIPVAVFGLGYFVSVATWLVLIGLARGTRARLNFALVRLMAAGCVVSVAFTVIMVTQLDARCPLCLGAHGANGILLISFVVALRSAPQALLAGDELGDQPEPLLAVTVALLGLCLTTITWSGLRLRAVQAHPPGLTASLAALNEHAELVELAFFADDRFTATTGGQERFNSVLRHDDPTIAATTGAAMTLVIFTDAECPSCGRFEQLLFDEVLPLFAGHLTVIYKHFPLAMHAHAEPAARALEAARQQGAFWEYQALLSKQRQQLSTVDYRALAGSLSLDLPRFSAASHSPDVVLRIAEDVRFGQRLAVDGTPSVFLDGRLVNPLARSLTGFWSRRAQALRDLRESRGEDW
jgi:protein-disulfide isomerase/uncharacterized membrane protein